MSKYILEFEEPLRALEDKIETLKSTSLKTGMDISSQLSQLNNKLDQLKESIYGNLSRWERVQLARHPSRPHSSDYIDAITESWFDLHGDRYFADDKAILGGLSRIEGKAVIIVAQEKGRSTKEKLHRNFGMPRPEGYRKALRLMKLAEKFNVPVVTLIDTIGAYPGLGAEERGQAEAIARNLYEMATLRTPMISIVIGEGASGGALGIGVTDKIACLENTWYSVISPEGCASILFHDTTKAIEAANSMKVSSLDLYEMGIADEIIKEPLGGAHRDLIESATNLKDAILRNLKKLNEYSISELIKNRKFKYDKIGSWTIDEQ